MSKGQLIPLDAYSMVKSVPMDRLIEFANGLYPDIKYDVERFPSFTAINPEFKKEVVGYPKRYLIAELVSPWVIMVDDLIKSDGCGTQMHNLNRLFACEGFTIHHSDSGTVFTYYTENAKRHVHAIRDNGKWEFYQSGTALPFEKPKYYQRRKIKDRFNAQIFKEYVLTLGIQDVAALLQSSSRLCILRINPIRR
jgi:hypothetical protein